MPSAVAPRGRPSTRGTARDAALPLRPLTVGELLDSAVQLIRVRPWLLLVAATGLALLEQAVLFPIRQGIDLRLEYGAPSLIELDRPGYWTSLALGAGLEVLIIMLLAPLAGRTAVLDLVGSTGSRRGWSRLGLASTVVVVAVLAAALSGAGALGGPFWMLGYAIFGLAGVIAMVERRGPLGALGRSASLAFRAGGRVVGVRLLGYLAWLMLRFAYYQGVLNALDFAGVTGPQRPWILIAALAVGNAVAYSMLACLDAAVLIEARIRTEALDLWLRRWAARTPLTAQALEVRR